MPSQQANLLMQSYFTMWLLKELKMENFLESKYYKELQTSNPMIKEYVTQLGIDNQGCFLLEFYTMLVLPKQLLEDKFSDEFEKVNKKIKELEQGSTSTYKSDIKNGVQEINYIRHIRNAVAHANVEFVPMQYVIFKDQNPKEECEIKILLKDIPEVLGSLHRVIERYVESGEVNK